MYLQSWRRTNPKKRNHHDLWCILKGDLKRAVRKVKMSGQKSCESSSPKWLEEAKKLNWALMSGQKSSQGSERPSWDGRCLAIWPISKTDSQPILKVASLQCEAKENIMLFSQSGIWRADSVLGYEFEDIMLKRSTKSWRGIHPRQCCGAC